MIKLKKLLAIAAYTLIYCALVCIIFYISAELISQKYGCDCGCDYVENRFCHCNCDYWRLNGLLLFSATASVFLPFLLIVAFKKIMRLVKKNGKK